MTYLSAAIRTVKRPSSDDGAREGTEDHARPAPERGEAWAVAEPGGANAGQSRGASVSSRRSELTSDSISVAKATMSERP